MMKVSLPSTAATNGTYLRLQAEHSIVRSMITRQGRFHPRYGVNPGFGMDSTRGLPGVFTSTVTAALEMGAMAYAKGVVDNYFNHYVRYDGMINHQGMELPASARVLGSLALYRSYSGDDSFVLGHFNKAKALATWLMYRRSLSLSYSPHDPRYGIPLGDAEADNFAAVRDHSREPLHFLSSAAEMYRAFTEAGAVWLDIGKSAGRSDVVDHGVELLRVAPLLYQDLHTSLNHTGHTADLPNSQQGPHCWPYVADPPADMAGQAAHAYRAYPELCYSGALSSEQVDDIYMCMAQGVNRSLTLGIPAFGSSISLRAPFGLAFALLQHDFVERFLLHFFAVSAHGYTRGSWTTPESSNVADRDEPTVAYAVTGVNTVPTYLKWMLVFEEPETRTLWLAKATPRDWLAPGESPLVVQGATTRYGRISFSLSVPPAISSSGYFVKANVTLPRSFVSLGPQGGLRLRIRAPMSHAGKLSSVSVGGKVWSGFEASTETVEFKASELTSEMVESGLPSIVAEFAATTAVPLRRAKVDLSQRVLASFEKLKFESIKSIY